MRERKKNGNNVNDVNSYRDFGTDQTTIQVFYCVIVMEANIFELVRIAQIQGGYPFRGPIDEVADGKALVAQMKDVAPMRGVRWAGAVRTELQGRKGPDWLQAGDILFVPRGSHFFAASIDAPPGPAVCGPHLFHIRVRPGAGVLPEFLAWQINQAPAQRQLHAAAEGSSQLSIRKGEIEALRIAVPPLKQQQRIVALATLAARERQLLQLLIQNREQELTALASTLAHAAGFDTN